MRAVLIALLSLVLVPAAALAAPSVTIDAPAEGAKVGPDVPLQLSGISDETDKLEFYDGASLEGTINAPGPYSFTFQDLSAGQHTLTVRAYDGVDTTEDSVTVFVDDDVYAEFIAPTPAQGSTTKAESITINFFTDEDVVEVRCGVDPPASYDETDLGTCEDPWVLDGLGDGQHTVAIWVKDDVGNVAFFARTFKVDRTAPVLTVTSPAEGAVFNATAIAPGYQVEDAAGSAITVTCSLDGGAFGACSFPATEGPHTLTVRAEDTVANRSEVTRSFTIDKTLPALSASASTDGDTATVVYTASDATPVTVTCALDGGPAAPCASPITFAHLGEGEHSVVVRAQDAAGNARSVDVRFLIEKDGIIDIPGGGKKRKLVLKVPGRVDRSASGNRLRIKLRTPNKKRCVVTLRDADGRVVIRRKIRGFRKYTVTFLLAKVEPGSYTVRAKCKGRAAKRKKVEIVA